MYYQLLLITAVAILPNLGWLLLAFHLTERIQK